MSAAHSSEQSEQAEQAKDTGAASVESWPLRAAAWASAAVLILAACGYSYMDGNHEVYLLQPLQTAGLADFSGDWFTTETLQYHGLFSLLASGLFRLGVAKVGFFAGFLLMLAAVVWVWWNIVKTLGGGVLAFVVAVAAYHVLLGDRALGFYSLLQDGQFNAGNVAAVCFLAAGLFFLRGKPWPTAVLLGAAGVMHLNYALVGVGMWGVISAWPLWQEKAKPRALFGPSAVALLPCLVNIGLALPAKLQASGGMPLGEFLDLYVFFRHAHHYAPTTWPAVVWIAFVLPLPLAAIAIWTRRDETSVRRGGVLLLVLLGLQVFALLTAGVFYLGESFVQLSLWRVSPHAKLLAVTMAAVWLTQWRVGRGLGVAALACLVVGVAGALVFAEVSESGLAERIGRQQRLVLSFGIGFACLTAVAVIAISRGKDRVAAARFAGITTSLCLAMMLTVAYRVGLDLPGQTPATAYMLDTADWAKDNTPGDAVFLVPPGAGSAFSLHGRRSQVVAFKLVPQLSGELAEWKGRLQTVLGTDDLLAFVRDVAAYRQAQDAMDDAYADRSLTELAEVARQYGARYVLTLKPSRGAAELGASPVYSHTSGATLYDLRPDDTSTIDP